MAVVAAPGDMIGGRLPAFVADALVVAAAAVVVVAVVVAPVVVVTCVASADTS